MTSTRPRVSGGGGAVAAVAGSTSLKLTSPVTGTEITGLNAADLGIEYVGADTYESFVVPNPEAGTWAIEIDGTGLAGDIEVTLATAVSYPAEVDGDGDGLPDSGDNCVAASNVDQLDMDLDGLGDVCDSDADGDAVANLDDNCAAFPNADQLNTDSAPVTTPGIVPQDKTLPNSDVLGDACDWDDDNDGVADEVEVMLGSGGPSPPGPCSSATGPTNPLVRDTDGDGVIDGAECALGSDPVNAGSKPASVPAGDSDADGLPDWLELQIGSNPNAVQSDGDGISDGIEYKGYGSSPVMTDTDLDGCSDNREIASVDGNTVVNILDIGILVNSFGVNGLNRPHLDLTRNGSIDILDILLVAANFVGTPC